MNPVPGIADARSALPPGVLGDVEDAAPVGSRRYGVLIGGERLLLAGDGAVRVLEPPAAFRLPNTRGWFLGLSNVRGNLVPVFDLAAWQGLPIPEARRMLLVMGEAEAAAGTLVDTSPRHLLIPPDTAAATLPALSTGFAAHAREAFDVAGGTWTALDWPALFEQLKTLALSAE